MPRGDALTRILTGQRTGTALSTIIKRGGGVFDKLYDDGGAVFNVKHPRFGAAGDGLNDDTAAWQAAIDQAELEQGIVIAPPGTYIISSLTIDSHSISIIGMGLGGVVLQQKNGAQNSNLLIIDTNNIEIQRIRLNGLGKTSGTAYGIYADATGLPNTTMGRLRLRDVQVQNFGGDGIYMYKPERAELRHIHVTDCGGVGVHLKADPSGRGINNVMENVRAMSCLGTQQIYLEAQLVSCKLTNVQGLSGVAGGHNIRITGTGHTLIGCDAESGGDVGIYASGSGHTFIGCYAHDLTHGIYLVSAVDCVIAGLRASGSVTRSLRIDSTSEAVLLSIVDGSTGGVLNQGKLARFDDAGFALPADTPTALGAGNNNNYDPGDATILRLSANSSGSTITGVAGGHRGRQLFLVNVSANVLTIAHEDGSSTSTNRIYSPSGDDLRLGENESVRVYYDDTTDRWRIINAFDQYARVESPSALAAGATNDWEPGPGTLLRVTGNATTSEITGIAAGSDGRNLIIVNVGTDDIIIRNQAGLSSASNRVITGTGSNIKLSQNQSVIVVYDATTARWRVLNVSDVHATVYTDSTRGSAGRAGRIIFNSGDGQLNVDDGTNWTLPDGTTT
jgi:hypothetical protein